MVLLIDVTRGPMPKATSRSSLGRATVVVVPLVVTACGTSFEIKYDPLTSATLKGLELSNRCGVAALELFAFRTVVS